MSTLLVTAVGGHLGELHRLVPRLRGIDRPFTWVTFDTPQSRSLLTEEDVVFVDYTGPRDLRNILRHTRLARRMLRRNGAFSAVVSNGSGIALSFLPIARARGIACHYIENGARTDGPSTTGRLLERLPGVALYTQYPAWESPRWRYAGSIFDAFSVGSPVPRRRALNRVVVTLGTMETYGFRRLVERLVQVIPAEVEVLWQVGSTDVSGLPITPRPVVPAPELERAVAEADVVVAHAGLGSSVMALEAGRCPVLVPRLSALGENVDDHQLQIARALEHRGLAVARAVDELTYDDLLDAASRRTEVAREVSPFVLSPP